MLDGLFNIFEKAPSGWLIVICLASILFGMFALIKGADFFVGGSASIARKIGVSTLVIGLTVVSLGTSLPEASVSISSAIRGSSGLSMGNIIGSNLFNILVVIGSSIIFVPLAIKKEILTRDLPVLLFSGLLLLGFTLFFGTNGNYDILRFEAIIMLVIFIGYMIYSVISSKKQETEEEKKPEFNRTWVCILAVLLGIVGIAVGGEFVTWGASELAIKLGADEILVGLTIVSIGTSLPELVTSVVAAKKHEADIALGNAIGSCTFNILFIVGAAATISPYKGIDGTILFDMIFMISVFVIVLLFGIFSKKGIGKKTGIFFIALYVGYFIYIILRNYCF